MIGATVMEKGTSNGTTTDAAGEYTIKVRSSNAVLIYTSLSYVTVEQPIKGKTVINVTMEDDALSLSEVVVTGYGQTVTKDKLTAAISKVTSDEIGRGSHGNALQTLSGAVTGVRVATTTGQPGTSPSIVIRGGAALDGSGTPLYIIDGVQKPDMSDINSHDIESIEILKDAAATALYGARAMNGVVVVTTKRGNEGKPVISYSGNYTVQLKPRYSDYDIMNSSDQMSVYAELERKGYLTSDIVNKSNSGIYGKMYNLINTFDEKPDSLAWKILLQPAMHSCFDMPMRTRIGLISCSRIHCNKNIPSVYLEVAHAVSRMYHSVS